MIEIDRLLRKSVGKGASDLHLIPDLAPTVRVDGVLMPIKGEAVLSNDEVKQILYQLMTAAQREHFERALVVEFAYANEFGNYRVSVYRQLHGIAAALRVVPPVIPSLEEIGLPLIFTKLLMMSRGLILVAGPTGSGKSTSLAAMLDYINSHRICNIITVEDPIEFIYSNKRSIFNQMQVGRDTMSFASALRAALRQDPNVIMLGELRDLETMRLALTAVETGHLVLATIHASSAPLAISRFADVFPSGEKNRVRVLLSETLEAVLCQRLIRKPAGGRVGVYELMTATPAIRHYIKQDMPSNMVSTMQTGSDKGMTTFEYSLHDLVKKHVLTQAIANNILSELNSDLESILPK